MGCSRCGSTPKTVSQKKPGEGGEWMLVSATGEVTYYQTQLAAKAANARQGGRGLVKRAP